jgi:hypothetical protein
VVTSPRADETVQSAAPVVAPPQQAEPDPTPKPADALESLEEEMAKLLGRKP